MASLYLLQHFVRPWCLWWIPSSISDLKVHGIIASFVFLHNLFLTYNASTLEILHSSTLRLWNFFHVVANPSWLHCLTSWRESSYLVSILMHSCASLCLSCSSSTASHMLQQYHSVHTKLQVTWDHKHRGLVIRVRVNLDWKELYWSKQLSRKWCKVILEPKQLSV